MAGEPLVLVVEDEPAQREVLAYNIRAEGYEVVTAEAGDEALVIVRETPPDVIILDWMLPNVSGIEVCRQLKMSGDTARIPVILSCPPVPRRRTRSVGSRRARTTT